MEYIERLAAEWYEYQGFFVRRDLWVGLESDGSYECELCIVAFHPTRRHLAPNETWGMRVDRHGSQQHRTSQIVTHLARAIDRRVELDHPDKVVRVDIVGKRAAVSILQPDDIFSSAAAGHVKRVSPPAMSGEPEKPPLETS